MKLRAAICAICNGSIYVEMAERRHAAVEPSVQHKFQAALAAHLDTHPAAMQARLKLACKLDQDQRACYTIDEVLGTAAAYRLWLSSTRFNLESVVPLADCGAPSG